MSSLLSYVFFDNDLLVLALIVLVIVLIIYFARRA